MKGIILAGGRGSRLYPSTHSISKQIVPVYDKPLIYYPLSILMLAGIKDILVISTPDHLPLFKNLLGDGASLGLQLSYLEQPKPQGIAQAFTLAEEFIENKPVGLILGDNIFYGDYMQSLLSSAIEDIQTGTCGAKVFAYHVSNPSDYGVINFDKNQVALDIEEKPTQPKSNYAVTGLYFYDSQVVKHATSLKPSPRGELEITDLNKIYLKEKRLKVETMGRGIAWLDTGTADGLLDASNFIATIEKRQGYKIACLEEIAYRKGFINKDAIKIKAESLHNTVYGQYLLKIYNEL